MEIGNAAAHVHGDFTAADEHVSQLLAATLNARFHSGQRDAGLSRGFGLRQPSQRDEFDSGSVWFRQAPDHRRETRRELRFSGLPRGRVGLIGDIDLEWIGPAISPLTGAQRVAERVPRTANRILTAHLRASRISATDIVEQYTPFGHSDYQAIVAEIKHFGRNGDAAVLSTINGDSNVAFYREFARQGLTPKTIPVMAYSIAEDELRSMASGDLVGHLAAWNYYQSIDTPENRRFVGAFKAFAERNGLPGGARRVTDDPIEAAYAGVYVWKAAVEKARSFDVTKVTAAVLGLDFDAPGGSKRMHRTNHHTYKPVYVGRVRADGQFDIIWQSQQLLEPQAFSPYLNPARATN